jgi:membrane protein implicated in regulation of membrane protease activity
MNKWTPGSVFVYVMLGLFIVNFGGTVLLGSMMAIQALMNFIGPLILFVFLAALPVLVILSFKKTLDERASKAKEVNGGSSN